MMTDRHFVLVSFVGQHKRPLSWVEHCVPTYRISEPIFNNAGRTRRTARRVREEELVKESPEDRGGDVRERRESSVRPPASGAAPDCERHHATADVARRVRREADRREAPDRGTIREANDPRHGMGHDEHVRWVEARPDGAAEHEVDYKFVHEDVADRTARAEVECDHPCWSTRRELDSVCGHV